MVDTGWTGYVIRSMDREIGVTVDLGGLQMANSFADTTNQMMETLD